MFWKPSKVAKHTRITVHRFVNDGDSTLSVVKINGEFQCFGLEDEPREFKVPGETRVPAGRYRVDPRVVGGFHSRYSAKFPGFHRGMLWVRNVPGFKYVLIHCGNNDDDTAGCLLVGEKASATPQAMRLMFSVVAYKKLYAKVIDAAFEGKLTIEFIDGDT